MLRILGIALALLACAAPHRVFAEESSEVIDKSNPSKDADSSLSTSPETFTTPSTDDFFFAETFQGDFTWVLSGDSKYGNQPVEVIESKDLKKPFNEDRSVILKSPNQHYGFAAPLPGALDVTDKTFVFQYEVKLTQGLSCGGAYVKLLAKENDLDLATMNNESPYIVMFGPDSCGDTNKVHLIIRHRNPVSGEWEEKHAKNTPAPKKDRQSHVYTVVIRPNNSYEIFIDMESKATGSLLEDFNPPFNPPAQIDDPTDSKPEDWVDDAQIRDPEAVKPDDWDENAPKKILDESATMPSDWLEEEEFMIPDPSATMPEDWDEEEDGDWEAPEVPNPKCAKISGCGEWKRPLIDNPEYKGKWVAPLIDNPDYKGEWKARQIDNPAYFEDLHPHNLAPMAAVAVEIWTTNGGITMDNFIIGFDEDKAKEFARKTWKAKNEAEKQETQDKNREENRRARDVKRKQGGFMNMLEVYAGDFLDFVGENPIPAIGTLLAVLLSLVFFTTRSSKKTEETGNSQAADGNKTEKAEAASDKKQAESPSATEKVDKKKKQKKRAD